MVEKKISVQDLLRFEYEELGLTQPEIDLLKLKHSKGKYVSWMTKLNDVNPFWRKKRKSGYK